MMIYALCRKIDFVENLRVFGVKIWTGISIRVKKLTFSMSGLGLILDTHLMFPQQLYSVKFKMKLEISID